VNLVVNVTHPIDCDDVMLAAGSRIVLGQQDAIRALHVIDRADVLIARSDGKPGIWNSGGLFAYHWSRIVLFGAGYRRNSSVVRLGVGANS
jgi:hypothetical protein